jgi:hypothetical protein
VLWKPSKSQLGEMLGISGEMFHKKIKPRIKKDFAKELYEKGIDNPDIWLDETDKMTLIKPGDSTKFIETDLSIFSYK